MLVHRLHQQQHMTLPPKVPLTSPGRSRACAFSCSIPGTPCETLYKSPLIFIKVECYYVFSGAVTPTCMESMRPCYVLVLPQSPPAWSGVPSSLCFFFPCKVLHKVVPRHLAPLLSPQVLWGLTPEGPWEVEPEQLLVFLLLRDWGQSPRCSSSAPGAAPRARPWAGEEQSWQPPCRKECCCSPLKSLPAGSSCHPSHAPQSQ